MDTVFNNNNKCNNDFRYNPYLEYVRRLYNPLEDSPHSLRVNPSHMATQKSNHTSST